MSSLRRTKAGRFSLSDSVPLQELISADDPEHFLLPVDTLFSGFPACTLEENQAALCRHGTAVPFPGRTPGRCRVYAPDGEFLMVGRIENEMLLTEKSFFEV